MNPSHYGNWLEVGTYPTDILGNMEYIVCPNHYNEIMTISGNSLVFGIISGNTLNTLSISSRIIKLDPVKHLIDKNRRLQERFPLQLLKAHFARPVPFGISVSSIPIEKFNQMTIMHPHCLGNIMAIDTDLHSIRVIVRDYEALTITMNRKLTPTRLKPIYSKSCECAAFAFL